MKKLCQKVPFIFGLTISLGLKLPHCICSFVIEDSSWVVTLPHAKVGCASLRPFDKQPVAVIIVLRGGVISCQHRPFITNYQQRNWDCTGHEVASSALLGGGALCSSWFYCTHTSTHTSIQFLTNLKTLAANSATTSLRTGGSAMALGRVVLLITAWKSANSQSNEGRFRVAEVMTFASIMDESLAV